MITNVKMSYVLQPFDFQAEVILSESNFASNKYKWWLEKKQCHGFGRGARPGMGGKIGGMRVLMKMMHKRRARKEKRKWKGQEGRLETKPEQKPQQEEEV